MTLQSVEMFTEYEPGDYLPRITPTPLMMVVAARDHLTVVDLSTKAFSLAYEPKRLLVLAGGHFDAYVGEAFLVSSAAQRDWFLQHPGEDRPVAEAAQRPELADCQPRPACAC